MIIENPIPEQRRALSLAPGSAGGPVCPQATRHGEHMTHTLR